MVYNLTFDVHDTLNFQLQVLFEATSLSSGKSGSVGVDDIKLTPGYCHRRKFCTGGGPEGYLLEEEVHNGV